MRYHIDTIPVWDAMKLLGECPLCAIRRKNELYEAQRFLGGSVMEPDTRIQVNDKGFCAHHQVMLTKESNRLGHALMLHTHLIKTREKLQKINKEAINASEELSSTGFVGRISGKTGAPKEALKSVCDSIDALTHSCVICDSLNENMERYAASLLHLWNTENEFKRAFEKSKGVCIPDFSLLLRLSTQVLPAKAQAEFVHSLVKLQTENLQRIEEEIQFFTLQFDYRNQDRPWGECKDAVERTTNKLQGWCVGTEPNPKR
jgi:hypothetical protein